MQTLIDDYGQSICLIVFGLGVISIMAGMARWTIHTSYYADMNGGIDEEYESGGREDLQDQGNTLMQQIKQKYEEKGWGWFY